MTTPAPVVSVIMATWGRGRHILPSVMSVLQQNFRNLELIVAGDACLDETEAVVALVNDRRVRWINGAQRVGSQSGPNNAGIAAARGRIIAYLGHDDLWEPQHLSHVVRVFDGVSKPDFVVSGMIAHNPNGAPGSRVYGMIVSDADKHRHHFPPGCLAHRKSVIDKIGHWPMPQTIRAPIDVDFLARAVAADLRFETTGMVTVHRFSAADRYLSYVNPTAEEQEAMLTGMTQPGHAKRVAALVEVARGAGRFMMEEGRDYDRHLPGALAREAASKRGLMRPGLVPLGAGRVMRHPVENAALDWTQRPRLGVRRHDLNPRPRLLLSVTATGPVALTISIVHWDRKGVADLVLLCNGTAVTARVDAIRSSVWGWTARYRSVIRLRADQPSVLEIRLTALQQEKWQVGPFNFGFGVGKLRLAPFMGRDDETA